MGSIAEVFSGIGCIIWYMEAEFVGEVSLISKISIEF